MIDPYLFGKLLFIFITSFFFIKVIIHFAPKLGLIDIPNQRSIHDNVTPRGAGIGIVFAIMISDILFLNPLVIPYIYTFFAILLIFIVGILDDHRDTSPKTKFYIIFLAVLFLWMDDITITSLGTIFGFEISLGWFSIPFTMFAVAGFTNALNLSDGLDGLAGSLSIIILGTLAVIGYQNNDAFIISVSLSFIAGICAFMLFNWNPAKIFMGDSGSLTLGFLIALLSIKALTYIQHPTAILFIAAIPIIDTIIVMVRRKRSKLSVFSPDKTHLHHVLLGFFKGNVKKTVILIVLMQILYSIIGLNLIENDYKQRYVLIVFFLIILINYILLSGMLDRQMKPLSYHRQKIKKQQNKVRKVISD